MRRRRYLISVLGRIWSFVAIFLAVYVVSAVLFYFAEAPRHTLFNSFYWSIVTLGTVGYGDIVPVTIDGKILTTAVIFSQIFLIGYLISVITTTVTEEAQRRALGTYGTDLTGHIVVLGYSPVGQAAVRELLVQEQKVAVVTDRADDVANIRTLAPERQLFVTYGTPAEPAMRDRVNIAQAHSVIVCTTDDATNMIGALNIRAINPKLRIVVSVGRPELRDTLRAAGVTYVASPTDMGGRLCAAAAFEPEVAHAVEDLTAGDERSDILEFVLDPRSPLVGKSFAEADAAVRAASGALLIGHARPLPSGEYDTRINPPFDERLAAGDALIFVCTIANAHRLRQWLGTEQGR